MSVTRNFLVSQEEINSMKERFDFNFFSKRNVLITGGTGLVGGFLATTILECTKHLSKEAPKVTVTTKSNNLDNLFQVINFKNLLIRNIDLRNTIPRGDFDTVIHGASPASPKHILSEEDVKSINCNIFYDIHSSFPNLERMLFLSAGEVYGSKLPNLVPEEYKNQNPLQGQRSYYPNAKIEGELLTSNLGDLGISSHIVRLFHTYGPGVREYDGRSFSDFFWAIKRSSLPTLTSFGNQVRSFSYLEDSVIGLLLVLASGVSSPVNVGSSNPISVLDFAKRISNAAGHSGIVSFDASKLEEKNSPIDSIVPNNDLLKSLGWNESVSIDIGIARTLHWLKTTK